MVLLTRILEITFPISGILLVGYLYGKRRTIDTKIFMEIIIFLLAPALMFDSLARQNINWTNLGRTALFSLALHLIPGAIAWVIKVTFGIRQRIFIPSIMIMNSVSLPYPLALLAFGEEGLAHVVLLSIPNVFILFTIGLMLHGGKASATAPLRMPAIYTSIAGIAVAVFAWPVPKFFMQFTQLAGRGLFPLELFVLGYRLRSIRRTDFKFSMMVSLLRFTLGFATAWAISTVFELEGIFRAALFLLSTSPPANFNYVLAERYGNEGPLAASVVFTGTALSMLTTPLVLIYLELL